MDSSFDALIIGSGVAGLYTALCFADRFAGEPTRRIALITKSSLHSSASCWAQGGIAAVLDPQDSYVLHHHDTLLAGAGLCDPQAVDLLVTQAPQHIAKLLELGVCFDRTPSGTLALTLEAAHSRHRVLHSADATGKALVDTLTDRVLESPQITIFAETYVLDLLVQSGKCCGVRAQLPDRSVQIFGARATVLATGGGAYVYSQTTNPATSTGDGVVMAWQAGAILRDMEFVQFHPTALAIRGAPRFLISEAVRGEGAHLIDDRGERFAFRYHDRGELAPRDIVSRAIWQHLQETGAETVFLDLSPILKATIIHRFPNIAHICQEWQINIQEQPIPVTPAAHYCIGGIATNMSGQTSLPGLYAVGEVASTGVHGANRLASNSLLECFVFGNRLVQQVTLLDLPSNLSPPNLPKIPPSSEPHRQLIRDLCWRAAGIVRNQESLAEGLATLQQWRQRLAPDRETSYLLEYGALILQAALFRTESRGAHYREDFAAPNQQWQKHTLIDGNRCYLAADSSF